MISGLSLRLARPRTVTFFRRRRRWNRRADETMTDVIRLGDDDDDDEELPRARPGLIDSHGEVSSRKVSNWVLLSDRSARGPALAQYYHFKLTVRDVAVSHMQMSVWST